MTQTADPAPPAELAKIATENSIEMQVAMPIIKAFQPHYEELVKLVGESRAIQSHPESRSSDAKAARVARLAIVKCRVGMDHVREDQKSVFLRMGKAIQGIFNKGKGIAEPEESRLWEIEQFAEREEAARKQARWEVRADAIHSLDADPAAYNLMDMPDDTFTKLVNTLADAKAFRIEEARKLEEAKRELAEMEAAEKAAEAERHRKQFIENERLRKETLDQMAQLQAERQRAAEHAMAAEARAAEEKKKADEFFAEEMRRKQAEHDAQLAADRAARAKFEEDARIQREAAEEKLRQERAAVDALQRKQAAELAKAHEAQRQAQAEAKRLQEEAEAKKRQEEAQAAAKAQAEAKAKADEEGRIKAAKRLEELRPEADKIIAYIESLLRVPAPKVAEGPASDLLRVVSSRLSSLVIWCKTQAKAL